MLVYITNHVHDFINDGGLILYLYSIVTTRGFHLLNEEIGNFTTLVSSQLGFCTQELVNLVTYGRAVSNISPPVDPDQNYFVKQDIGIITVEDIEYQIALQGKKLVDDAFKYPKYPIWILHGDSHYTVLFTFSYTPGENFSQLLMYHYNGLPPGGPRLSTLIIKNGDALVSGTQNPDVYEKFNVISRREGINNWEYQVAYILGGEIDYLQETFPYDFKGKWRCMYCTNREPPNWAAFNDIELTVCKECDKERRICPWVPLECLPTIHQKWVMDRYSNRIVGLLRLVIPDCIVETELVPPSV
eukprot:TRINITY_DN4081_c0_g1_i1.p1 TRINITY_DN4081_c0_g1~~TRINITY_DN4081_c0_g1_i1.p1  ORF type:complete len:301 (+),score=52.30 TRINITY_DN4081_c0_g1_i1:574-1476(+)